VNALDVTARGLAKRALDTEVLSNEGAANIASRAAPTAAALEALSADYAALLGIAGESHTVETAPYLTRQRLVIRGNGAELRNVNPTPLSTNDVPSGALPMGVSNVWGTEWLTYYPVQSADGTVLALTAGDGDQFAAGNLVVVHGATSYFVSNGEYHVYRHYTRARVLAATASSVTLDRILPDELLADSPVIANADAGASSAIEGLPNYYLLYAPHVSNLTVASDLGETLKWGGVIDGTFRDLIMVGRNGIGLNAAQNCLFENIHFHSWRKIAEFGEGSYGTTFRSVRGSLADARTKLGGGDDTGPFFLSIAENSAYCVYEDFHVSSGPNNATGGVACQLGGGHNNAIRNSTLRFPAHTGDGLVIRSTPTVGNPNIDCGYENIDLHLPVGARFFTAGDAGAGLTRPYFRNIRCFGTVATRAGDIQGDQGVVENVWCESGALRIIQPCTNWRVENNYFPGGFESLTRAALNGNTIRNNECDASRRIASMAIVNAEQMTIASTAANTVAYSMAIAPGDLEFLDEVRFRLTGTTGGGGANTRHVRVTCQIDGATAVEIAHMTTTGNADSWAVEGTIEVQANTVVHAAAKTFAGSVATVKDTRISVGDLDLNGLVLAVEIWTDVSGLIATQLVKMAGHKAGMRNVPVYG
jgi:hypothetical protein